MFFSNCNWCCRRPCCAKQEKDCNKQDNKPCFHEDKRDDKQEKCYCHIRFENRCCWDKEHDNDYNKHDKCDKKDDRKEYRCGQEKKLCNRDNFNGYGFANYHDEDYTDNYRNQNIKDFGGREFYGEQEKSNYNNQEYLGYNYNQSYTPNWEEDKYCKCDRNDKHNDNKCCKPTKYICFPWDRY